MNDLHFKYLHIILLLSIFRYCILRYNIFFDSMILNFICLLYNVRLLTIRKAGICETETNKMENLLSYMEMV